MNQTWETGVNIASSPAPTKIKIGKLHRACSRTGHKGRKGQSILAVGNLCYPNQVVLGEKQKNQTPQGPPQGKLCIEIQCYSEMLKIVHQS